MTNIHKLEIFITAGGKSSRMGQDKGLVMLAEKPMLIHLTDKLRANNFPFTLIANSSEYGRFGFKTYKDLIPEKGPMGALLTAMHCSEKEYILLLGCDTPFLPIEAIKSLIRNKEKSLITISSLHQKLNPLQAIYHCSLKSKVIDCIAKNQLKMQSFILQSAHCSVGMDTLATQYPQGFINFNEPKDIIAWKTKD